MTWMESWKPKGALIADVCQEDLIAKGTNKYGFIVKRMMGL